MEPVKFELEQVRMLPMDAEYVTYAEHQPQYRPLPVARITSIEQRGLMSALRVTVISRWTFTPEERAQIAKGEDLYIECLMFKSRGGEPPQLQPILPSVGLRELCPTDAAR